MNDKVHLKHVQWWPGDETFEEDRRDSERFSKRQILRVTSALNCLDAESSSVCKPRDCLDGICAVVRFMCVIWPMENMLPEPFVEFVWGDAAHAHEWIHDIWSESDE